jgi:hypothetical protein
MIQIKEEFRKLIPALTAEEFKQLEQNCLRDGILSPICLWDDFIIDGHNRYEISLKHQLQFESIDFSFDSEEDVKNWMIEKQLGQRNLTKEQKDYLIGKRYENEKQKIGRPENKEEKISPLKTAEKIAEEVGISDRQVKINEQYAKGVDKMSEELKQQVLQGNSNINKGDVQIIAKAEPTFIATTEKEITEKAKEIKEQKAEAYKEKIQQRIETKTKEIPLSIDEQKMLDAIERGETVVINMNVHFHVLKYAKEKGIYKQIDRYSEYGNPYWLGTDGTRDEVCDGYIEFFKHKRSLHEKVKDLKGKVLGCHCAPLRCHGDHLKELANEN